MFSQRVARRATTTTLTTAKRLNSATTSTVDKPTLDLKDSQYAEKLLHKQEGDFVAYTRPAVQQYHKFISSTQSRPAPPSKLPPVYPFRPHAINPYTGDYQLRPGVRQPGVVDLDAPMGTQVLHYKRRLVNHHMAVANPEHVVGDQVIYQSRIESNKERLSVLFDDTVRPFLNRQTRVSPIYKDSTPELRTPRTPLPADTHTSVSPTAGVLHAYRMHWVRMYLHTKKKRQTWADLIPMSNVYDYDATIRAIKGANNAGLQEFMHLCKGVAAARNSNTVPADTAAFLGGIKKILPIVAKVDKVEVIKIRRRKK